jgi:tetratricopeptide (TPR) repeat protein
VTRKKKLSTNKLVTDQPIEDVPVVTPEIEDGYDGIVKRLVCLGCQHVFYLTDADFQSLHSTYCHTCSIKLVAEYEAKRQKEATEQEQREKGEIILALFADLQKPLEDTPEEAFVRGLVETKCKKDWNYGYKMLMCFPRHDERGRTWDVVLTKNEENPKRSIHVRQLLIEWSENCHMHLPYSKSIFYETDREPINRVKAMDAAIERHLNEPACYRAKADALVQLGEDQQALLYYDKAIELDASNTFSYCSKGDVLVRFDRAGEAMECYEKAISLEPDDISGYIHKARLLKELGRDEEVLALYDAFIATHPTNLEGYLQKAMFYISHDNYEEARNIHLQGKIAAREAN